MAMAALLPCRLRSPLHLSSFLAKFAPEFLGLAHMKCVGGSSFNRSNTLGCSVELPTCQRTTFCEKSGAPGGWATDDESWERMETKASAATRTGKLCFNRSPFAATNVISMI